MFLDTGSYFAIDLVNFLDLKLIQHVIAQLGSYFAIKNELTEVYYSFNRTCREINGEIDCSREGSSPFRLEPICHAEGRSINECWYIRETALALYFFLSVIFFREIQEMISSGPWAYFSSMENLLQDLIMILTASFIAVAPENTEIGSHLAAWAVFFAWVSTK